MEWFFLSQTGLSGQLAVPIISQFNEKELRFRFFAKFFLNFKYRHKKIVRVKVWVHNDVI